LGNRKGQGKELSGKKKVKGRRSTEQNNWEKIKISKLTQTREDSKRGKENIGRHHHRKKRKKQPGWGKKRAGE